jgi:hypothetical protein
LEVLDGELGDDGEGDCTITTFGNIIDIIIDIFKTFIDIGFDKPIVMMVFFHLSLQLFFIDILMFD